MSVGWLVWAAEFSQADGNLLHGAWSDCIVCTIVKTIGISSGAIAAVATIATISAISTIGAIETMATIAAIAATIAAIADTIAAIIGTLATATTYCHFACSRCK